MEKKHESKFLDKYIAFPVEISFKNKTKEAGFLYKNNKGYFIRRRGQGDLYFYKSNVKRLVTCYEKNKGAKDEKRK